MNKWRYINCNQPHSPTLQFLYDIYWLNACLVYIPCAVVCTCIYICAVLSPWFASCLKTRKAWPETLSLLEPQHCTLHRRGLRSWSWESPLRKPRAAFHYCHWNKCNAEIWKNCIYLLKHLIYFPEGPNASNNPTLSFLILISSFYP